MLQSEHLSIGSPLISCYCSSVKISQHNTWLYMLSLCFPPPHLRFFFFNKFLGKLNWKVKESTAKLPYNTVSSLPILKTHIRKNTFHCKRLKKVSPGKLGRKLNSAYLLRGNNRLQLPTVL